MFPSHRRHTDKYANSLRKSAEGIAKCAARLEDILTRNVPFRIDAAADERVRISAERVLQRSLRPPIATTTELSDKEQENSAKLSMDPNDNQENTMTQHVSADAWKRAAEPVTTSVTEEKKSFPAIAAERRLRQQRKRQRIRRDALAEEIESRTDTISRHLDLYPDGQVTAQVGILNIDSAPPPLKYSGNQAAFFVPWVNPTRL
jgi:hypothetical protein